MKNPLIVLSLSLLLAATACKKSEQEPAPTTEPPTEEPAAQNDDAPEENNEAQRDDEASRPDSAQSTHILDRSPATDYVMVQHVLLSWDEKADTYAMRGGQDPRGVERSYAEATELAQRTLERVEKGESFDALMRELSEDPGSARTAREYTVTPTASLVEPFKKLSLRLQPHEAGVVESDFGYHVIYRTR